MYTIQMYLGEKFLRGGPDRHKNTQAQSSEADKAPVSFPQIKAVRGGKGFVMVLGTHRAPSSWPKPLPQT